MLAATLGRHVGHGALEHLQERLLHALAGDVAGDRDVLTGLADLVDLVDVEHAPLGGLDVEIGGIKQFEEQVLHVLAHVACLSERGGIADGKRHVQNLGQRAGQQRLARTGGAEHQDVGLVDLDVAPLAAEVEPLVVAVDGDREHPLGVLLADHVLIEVADDLSGRRNGSEELLARAAPPLLLIQDRLAEVDALAADVDVARSLDQRAHVAVALATERTEGVLLGRPTGTTASQTADIFP